jgi:hypothetical protein
VQSRKCQPKAASRTQRYQKFYDKKYQIGYLKILHQILHQNFDFLAHLIQYNDIQNISHQEIESILGASYEISTINCCHNVCILTDKAQKIFKAVQKAATNASANTTTCTCSTLLSLALHIFNNCLNEFHNSYY